MNKNATTGDSPRELIDARIKEYDDWRGEVLAAVRELILSADASIVEEWKWNVPVWSSNGVICTGEVYKAAVKLTFAKGAAVADPAGLFNSSLEGKVRRALDIREGDKLNKKALTALIRAAAKHNQATAATPKKVAAKPATAKPAKRA